MTDGGDKKLRLWNGRGYICHKYDDPRWNGVRTGHVYIAAKNRADAARVMGEYMGRIPQGADHEIKTYFSECWGNPMAGIEPERGMWISFGGSWNVKPVRVV